MSTEDNKAAARSLFEEVLNNVNLAVIDEVLSPTYVPHALPVPFTAWRASNSSC